MIWLAGILGLTGGGLLGAAMVVVMTRSGFRAVRLPFGLLGASGLFALLAQSVVGKWPLIPTMAIVALSVSFLILAIVTILRRALRLVRPRPDSVSQRTA